MQEPLSSPNPAQVYQQHFVPAMFRPWADELVHRMPFRAGDHVLDVACGTGVVTFNIARVVGDHGSVTGVDISPQMLEVAASLTPEGAAISWHQGNAEALPFPDDQFDAITCQQGLQFVPDRPLAIREMRRVLRPAGTVGVAVWRDLEYQSLTAALVHAMDRQFGASAQGPFSLGNVNELRGYFEHAGFTDIRVETVKRDVHFPSVDTYVRLTVLSASAVLPELARVSEAERNAAIEAIREDIADDIERVRSGQGITFPMESHILLASNA